MLRRSVGPPIGPQRGDVPLPERKRSGWRPAWIGVVLAALLSMLFLRIHQPATSLGRQMLDLGHLPLFAVVGCLLLVATGWTRTRSAKALAGALAVGICLAGIGELGQTYVHRNANLRDFVHNLLGLALVFGGALALRRRRPVLAAIYVVLALAGVGLAVRPAARLVLGAPRLAGTFPRLGSFEERWELAFWHPTDRSQVGRSREVCSEGGWSLRVVCPPGPYPGVRVSDFPEDWAAYGSLRFDAYVPGTQPVKLYVRVDDQARSRPRSSLTRTFVLAPGWNREAVGVDDLAQAVGRPPRHVRRCLFFLASPRQETTLYLDNVRLSRGEPGL